MWHLGYADATFNEPGKNVKMYIKASTLTDFRSTLSDLIKELGLPVSGDYNFLYFYIIFLYLPPYIKPRVVL